MAKRSRFVAHEHLRTDYDIRNGMKQCRVNPSHIWAADLPFCPYCHISQEARVVWVGQERVRVRERKCQKERDDTCK
jgi:DNA-binding helix-hairpin-helix protein with protein kinase domain